MSIPTARTIRRALDVLERLPPEALGMVAEAIIDLLDAAEPDLDLEDDDPAEDDDPQGSEYNDGEGEPSEWGDIGGDLCRAADSNAPSLTAGFHL